MRVPLPGDHWAELLEPRDLRSGDMKAIRREQPLLVMQRTMGGWDDARDILLCRVITAWSLPLPLPSELPGTEEEAGSLDRLEIPVYEALLTAIEPHLSLLYGEDDPDPKPSPGSAGTSADSPSTSAST